MLISFATRSSARLLVLVIALGATFLLSTRLPAAPHAELLEDRATLDLEIQGSQSPASLLVERSKIHSQLGDLDAALLDLDRALRFGAGAGEVAFGRAEVRMLQRDFLAAEKAASAALKVDPTDVDARALRGRSRMEMGLFQLAADDFGSAATLAPRRPLDLVFAHAEACTQLPEDGRVRALSALEAEIQSRGPASSLLLAAFEHERALGRWDDALARLDQLRTQGWSEGRYGLLKGDVLRDAGDTSAARLSWKAGLGGLDQLPPRRRTTRAALRLQGELTARLGGKR